MNALRMIIALLLMTCAGCSATIIPPAHPVNPAAVFVTDYGRHSSVLLPAPQGHYVEYAFGEWGWFALRHTGPLDAIGALLFSSDSTLGRRQIVLYHEEPADVARSIGAVRVLKLDAAGAKVDALRTRLDDLYQKHIDTITYTPNSQLWFVKYRGGYNLLHNCNHVTADWLREMGCRIRGNAMFSKFKLDRADSKQSEGKPG